MAATGKGPDLAAVGNAGRSSSSSIAASLSPGILDNAGSTELSSRNSSRLLQTDFRSASSNSTNKAMLQDPAAFGLGLHNSVAHNDFLISSPHNLQSVMETPSDIQLDGLKDVDQRGEMQIGFILPPVQLRSPVPGDTPSPYSTYNGLSLQTSCSYDGGVSLQAAVGSNASGKFSHDSSEHPLPDMPTSSSSAVVTINSSPSIITHNGGNSDKSSKVLLSDLPSPYLSMPSNDLSDIDMEEEPGNRQVTCLWAGCRQEFSSLSQLVLHLDRCHTLAMTQYVCLWENCPRQLKPFDARYKLTTHLRCHTGEKPYQCEVPSCKRSFSRLENLKLHTRTHTGEKPYQCHHAGCSKRFNNTSDRAKHMKTHITRKPYACKHPGCNKSYTDPSSMRKHIKYSHKLKEEGEEGGLTLAGLPRRKRNSTSCSSSSSSSSAPHTPQQSMQMQQQIQGAVLLHSPPAAPVDDVAKTVVQTVSFVPSANSASVSVCTVNDCPSLTNSSTTPQIIPMVKLQRNMRTATGRTAPPILVPAYQQSPVMMIVPSNIAQSSISVGLTTSSTPASFTSPVVGATPASTGSTLTSSHQKPSHPNSHAVSQVFPTSLQEAQKMEHSHITTATSSSLSVEDQLRLQVVHLRQQLYQSQLAAAAAVTIPPQTISSSVIDSTRPVVYLQNSKLNPKTESSLEKNQVLSQLPLCTVGSPARELKTDVSKPILSKDSQTCPKAVHSVQHASTGMLSSSSVSLPLLDTKRRNIGPGPTLVSTSSIPVLAESRREERKGGISASVNSTQVLSVGGTSGVGISPVLNIGNAGGALLPQFISIPVIHTKGMAPDAQFIYMSS